MLSHVNVRRLAWAPFAVMTDVVGSMRVTGDVSVNLSLALLWSHAVFGGVQSRQRVTCAKPLSDLNGRGAQSSQRRHVVVAMTSALSSESKYQTKRVEILPHFQSNIIIFRRRPYLCSILFPIVFMRPSISQGSRGAARSPKLLPPQALNPTRRRESHIAHPGRTNHTSSSDQEQRFLNGCSMWIFILLKAVSRIQSCYQHNFESGVSWEL
jgi:hypothetical protein